MNTSEISTAEEIDYEALPDSAPLSHQLLAGAFAGIMEHSVMSVSYTHLDVYKRQF